MVPEIRPVRPRPLLHHWLDARDYTDAQAAELFGCTKQAVSNWRRPFDDARRRTPTPAFMAKIEEVTRGEVTPGSFYPPREAATERLTFTPAAAGAN